MMAPVLDKSSHFFVKIDEKSTKYDLKLRESS